MSTDAGPDPSDEARLVDSGERMIPEFHRGTINYAEHLQRYSAAAELCRGKVVLDIASGSGYGTQQLGESAAKAIGVDISEEAVAYANGHFASGNVEFHVGSGTAIPLDDDSVDVVVTFETIEHIEDYRQFVAEIRRVLKPGGTAIISTPNALEYEKNNHFHLHEFEHDELLALLRPSFPFIEEYYQATWRYVALDTFDGLASDSTRPTVNLAPLTAEQMRYFYFVCSDRKITVKPANLGAVGEHYSERRNIELHDEVGRLTRELEGIRASRSYRLATRISAIAAPFRR